MIFNTGFKHACVYETRNFTFAAITEYWFHLGVAESRVSRLGGIKTHSPITDFLHFIEPLKMCWHLNIFFGNNRRLACHGYIISLPAFIFFVRRVPITVMLKTLATMLSQEIFRAHLLLRSSINNAQASLAAVQYTKTTLANLEILN